MIDWHAVILGKLDRQAGLIPENETFEDELLNAMTRPLDGETYREELDRRYPNWKDEFND